MAAWRRGAAAALAAAVLLACCAFCSGALGCTWPEAVCYCPSCGGSGCGSRSDGTKIDGIACEAGADIYYHHWAWDFVESRICSVESEPLKTYKLTYECKCKDRHWCVAPCDTEECEKFPLDHARATGKCCGPTELCCNADGQLSGHWGQCMAPCIGNEGPFCCVPNGKCCGEECCGPGDVCCGSHCCGAGKICCGSDCCGAGKICCGSHCCLRGEACCGDQCCRADEKCCGDYCCFVGDHCCGDHCCAKQHACCGNSCCGQDQACRWGWWCAPTPPPPRPPPPARPSRPPRACTKATDADCDGVPDRLDKCKHTYNPTQADADNDGIGNACGCARMPSKTTRLRLSGGFSGSVVVDDNGAALVDLGMLNQDTKKYRPLAMWVGVPYVEVATSKQRTPVKVRLTAVPTKDSRVPHARLAALTPISIPRLGLQVLAEFDVDNLGRASKSCLRIQVAFRLTQSGPGKRLESGDPPSNSVKGCNPVQGAEALAGGFACGAVRASVSYRMLTPRDGETITNIKAAQKLHFAPDNRPIVEAGLFRDCDDTALKFSPGCQAGMLSGRVNIPVFNRVQYPATTLSGQCFGPNSDINFDNVHLTSATTTSGAPRPFNVPQVPFVPGTGCPECIHLHWRWGLVTNDVPGRPRDFTTGKPIAGDATHMKYCFASPDTSDAFPKGLCTSKSAARSQRLQVLWLRSEGNKPQGTLLAHSFFANAAGA